MTNELRALDAQVAEKIMGWLQWDGEDDWNGPPDKTMFFRGGGKWLSVYENGYENPTRHVAFSSDIESAMEVVEKMRELGWSFGAQRGWPTDREQRWLAEFGSRARAYHEYDGSLPLAITLAALKAVEGE